MEQVLEKGVSGRGEWDMDLRAPRGWQHPWKPARTECVLSIGIWTEQMPRGEQRVPGQTLWETAGSSTPLQGHMNLRGLLKIRPYQAMATLS